MLRRNTLTEVKAKQKLRPADSFAWLMQIMRAAWRGLREWCGDSAYERYLRSRAAQCPGCRTLTSAEFYLEQLNRRYSRPNRCC